MTRTDKNEYLYTAIMVAVFVFFWVPHAHAQAVDYTANIDTLTIESGLSEGGPPFFDLTQYLDVFMPLHTAYNKSILRCYGTDVCTFSNPDYIFFENKVDSFQRTYVLPDPANAIGNWVTVSLYEGYNNDNAADLRGSATFMIENDYTITEYVPPPPPPPPIENITWRTGTGFWGSTTPMMIIDDMTASVQDTNASVLPLLTFVGIPIGFVLAGFLIYQIRMSLEPAYGKRKRRNKIK